MDKKITHINCDMAESYGSFKIGHDKEILPYINAANIACGFHGGDPKTICETIKSALDAGVEIGAHPSYPDLAGFGRRVMQLSDDDLKAALVYQINVVKGITEMYGGKMNHVKLHGALYNVASANLREAKIFCDVIKMIDDALVTYAMRGSVLADVAKAQNIEVKYEAFADRAYNSQGKLIPRSEIKSVLSTVDEIVDQFNYLSKGYVKTIDSVLIDLESDTLCLHGDHPLVLEVLKKIYKP